MKLARIIAGILAAIPLTMIIWAILDPSVHQPRNSPFEYAYLCIGIPIMVANYLLWCEPDVVKYIVKGKG